MYKEHFGEYLRKLRLERRIGLRSFAKVLGIQPSNLCNIEIGQLNAPRSPELLHRITKALKLKSDSQEYQKLFDLAAKPGELPADVKEYFCEKNIMEELPVMARTIKNKKLTRKEIEKLIEELKGR
ncbi:MAG: helix-turn-helix transcriptional regulator [Candidatus Omnitrophota bacterium]